MPTDAISLHSKTPEPKTIDIPPKVEDSTPESEHQKFAKDAGYETENSGDNNSVEHANHHKKESEEQDIEFLLLSWDNVNGAQSNGVESPSTTTPPITDNVEGDTIHTNDSDPIKYSEILPHSSEVDDFRLTNKHLDITELKDLLNKEQIPMSEDEVKELFNLIDKNGSSYIGIEEYQQFRGETVAANKPAQSNHSSQPADTSAYQNYHNMADGVLEQRDSDRGTLTLNGSEVSYTVDGGVVNTQEGGDYIQPTTVEEGWTQIVTMGTSRGGGGSEKNVSIDARLMKAQGFELIGVEGTKDKKVEMWGRVFDSDKGHNSDVIISSNGKDVAFTVHTIETDLNVGTLEDNAKSDNIKLPKGAIEGEMDIDGLNNYNFKISSIFFDDTVKVTDMPDNSMQFYGQGDGDGLFVWIGGEGDKPPQDVGFKNISVGGKQKESMGTGLRL